MKKVLVFGGSGFIGSHVIEELLRRKCHVLNFDLNEIDIEVNGDYSFFRGSMMDYPVVSNTICEYRGCDAVFNFAGISDMDECNVKPLDTARKNVLGNQYILQGIADYLNSGLIYRPSPPKFLFASSLHVYNDFSGPYGIGKRSCEEWTTWYSNEFKFPYVIMRIGTVYGPRAKENNVIRRMVEEALEKKTITYDGSSTEVRAYIFVRDLAKYCVNLIDERFDNSIIELAGKELVSANKLCATLSEIILDGCKFSFKGKENRSHYFTTPYRLINVVGERYSGDSYHDLGAGLLEVIKGVKDE